MAELHDATEEYLETILEIEEEGIPPIRARLVERLGISAPAVSETVNRLVEQGYAELLDDRTLRLTDKGRELAVSIVRRHRLAERLLTDVIGLEWEKVHREADRWEHAISADVEEKLVALLGDPATCPHGNPIPGSKHRPNTRGAQPLARATAGPVRVARISEKLELDDDALSFLASAQLTPGSEAVVVGPGGTWALSVARAHGQYRKRNGHWYAWNRSTESWVPWDAAPITAARMAGHRLELLLDRAGLPPSVEACLITGREMQVSWEGDQRPGIHVQEDPEHLARRIARDEVLSDAQVDRIVALLDPRQPLPRLAPSTPRG